jgi:hypothetical protein
MCNAYYSESLGYPTVSNTHSYNAHLKGTSPSAMLDSIMDECINCAGASYIPQLNSSVPTSIIRTLAWYMDGL